MTLPWHPGTDSILRLPGSQLLKAGAHPGDLLVSTEASAHTVVVPFRIWLARRWPRNLGKMYPGGGSGIFVVSWIGGCYSCGLVLGLGWLPAGRCGVIGLSV